MGAYLQLEEPLQIPDMLLVLRQDVKSGLDCVRFHFREGDSGSNLDAASRCFFGGSSHTVLA